MDFINDAARAEAAHALIALMNPRNGGRFQPATIGHTSCGHTFGEVIVGGTGWMRLVSVVAHAALTPYGGDDETYVRCVERDLLTRHELSRDLAGARDLVTPLAPGFKRKAVRDAILVARDHLETYSVELDMLAWELATEGTLTFDRGRELVAR